MRTSSSLRPIVVLSAAVLFFAAPVFSAELSAPIKPDDMYAALRNHPETLPDRVHPNTAGATLMAKAAYKVLTGNAEVTEPAARQRWARLQKEIPELPVAVRNGKTCVLPAAKYGGRGNCENPELYVVSPFRIYTVGKPDLEIGRNTFAVRAERAFHGWQQNSVQAALLGLAGEARRMLVANASRKHGGSRFPAFWGPNYDWIPDQCHGGNLLNTAQTMLMQAEGNKILLLPAWPKPWDVHFKLHAPQNTTVEGIVKGGKIETLKVTPESRAKDVEIMAAQ